jgi:hypothetical protein
MSEKRDLLAQYLAEKNRAERRAIDLAFRLHMAEQAAAEATLRLRGGAEALKAWLVVEKWMRTIGAIPGGDQHDGARDSASRRLFAAVGQAMLVTKEVFDGSGWR